MSIKEYCTKDVEFVGPDTSIKELAQRMKQKDCGSILIAENERLVGVVTDRDIVVRALSENEDVSHLTAQDVMSAQVLYCFETDTPEDVLKNMADNAVKRLPVLDRDKNLVGIISFGDVSAGANDKQHAGEAMKEIRKAA